MFLVVMILATNLPWITRRVLFLFEPRVGTTKGPGWRVLEWLVLLGVVLGVGWGLEHRTTGSLHGQGGVFYTVLVSVYAAFALPGLLYYFERRPAKGERS